MKKKVLIAGPPTSDTQLVLSRQVSVPQRLFTPQEKALLNPVTSYSDKNYADDGAKTATMPLQLGVPVYQFYSQANL